MSDEKWMLTDEMKEYYMNCSIKPGILDTVKYPSCGKDDDGNFICNRCPNSGHNGYGYPPKCCSLCSMCDIQPKNRRCIRLSFTDYALTLGIPFRIVMEKYSQIPWDCPCVLSMPENVVRKIVSEMIEFLMGICVLSGVTSDEFLDFTSYYKLQTDTELVRKTLNKVQLTAETEKDTQIIERIILFREKYNKILDF